MLSVLLGGDVFIDRPSSKGVFDGLGSLREESEFFFANLEGPLTHATEGTRWRAGPDHLYWKAPWETPHWMKMRPDAVEDLSVISALTLANNHTMDYGVEGLLETLEVLDQAGIGHAGAGRTWDEATKPSIAAHQGTRVALLSYTAVFYPGGGATESSPGLAILKVRTSYEVPRGLFVTPGAPTVVHTWVQDNVLLDLEHDIVAARADADVVVVAFHWGVGDSRGVEKYQSRLARACIDAGATIVHGVHPHYHGPMEVYRGCPIFYSLGHLVFDTPDELKRVEETRYVHGRDSVVARCIVDDKRVIRVEISPLSPDDNNNPTLCEGVRGEEIARQVMEFPGTRDMSGTWDGSKLIVELGRA